MAIQLPQYQPQQIGPAGAAPQRGYGGQLALGQAQQRAIGATLTAGEQAIRIVEHVRDARAADEFAKLAAKFGEWSTGFIRDIEANPRMVSPEQGSEEYQNNYQEFVRSRDAFLQEITPHIRNSRAADKFDRYVNEQSVMLEDEIKRFDIAKNREYLFAGFADTFTQAIEQGDPVLALTIADEYADNNIIDQTQRGEYLLEGFEDIARRNSLMAGRAMGYDEGITWAGNRENLHWTTHTGERRLLSLQDQEALVAQLNRERAAERAEGEYARREDDRVGNEQAQRLFRTDQLSYEWIQHGENGLSWASRERWWGMLQDRNARLEAIAIDGDVPEMGDGYSVEELYRMSSRGQDPIYLAEAALEAFSSGRISETQYRAFSNWDSSNNPYTVLEDAYAYFDDIADGLGLDRLELGALRRDYRERLINDRFLQEGPAGMELNPERYSQDDLMQMARNLADPHVVGELTEGMFRFDERQLFGYRPNSAEDLLRSIDDGRLTGVEDQYVDELNRLETGHTDMMRALFGRDPDLSMRTRGGKTLFEYDGLTFKFTWDDGRNDEQLVVWDDRGGRWRAVPHDSLGADEDHVNEATESARRMREELQDQFPQHATRIPQMPEPLTSSGRAAAHQALTEWMHRVPAGNQARLVGREIDRIVREYGVQADEVRRIYRELSRQR